MRLIHRTAASLVGSTFLALGCLTPGVPRDELPERAIAFVYHPEDEARRRAESVSKRAAPHAIRGSGKRGVADLNALHSYLDETLGGRRDVEFAGRLALLDPRSDRLTLVESARRGAVPQDWSADGRRLLFAQRDVRALQLYEFDRSSGSVSRLTRGPEHHPQGCYGPDGRLVVVVEWNDRIADAEEGGRPMSRIGVATAGEAIELISPGPRDRDPACAPDGTAVAYVRYTDRPDGEIWVHSFAGEGSPRFVAPGRDPVFAADGDWIVYSQRVGGRPALWRIRRDGAGRSRIGGGSGAPELGPAVSPDGAMVVYESVSKNRYRLFVRRFDGSGDRVLFSAGDGTHAVW